MLIGWTELAAVALGSAAGGMARYWVTALVSRVCTSAFPWGTLVVNVSGAALAGLILGLLTIKTPIIASQTAVALLLIGFCGSYTTVSSFALQSFVLFRDGRSMAAIGNIIGSFVLSLLAAYLAIYIIAARSELGPWQIAGGLW
ncbi:CrcB family protein [Halorhodospira halochloris]|uniref:fluoride efflux transporter FluC n=1 Tax=Halorhodospira halochloris TaxID=1052 RepID=UPI001EE86A65|nr:CrcB family protein [Halorhodospira halochloris]MCG5529892.1 CrcB family protein [Halorhodospira halochloris]